VGARDYFKSHPKPKTPHDLVKHRRIHFRHGTAGVYHWQFDKDKKSLSVAVNGSREELWNPAELLFMRRNVSRHPARKNRARWSAAAVRPGE